jgi:hypothetical membrane protein
MATLQKQWWNITTRRPRRWIVQSILLVCGIAAALVYVVADIIGSIMYPTYSFADQAVSELFAIGAPTSRFIIPVFNLSSFLLAFFAVGVWMSSRRNRLLQLMAAMFGGSAFVGVVLWTFFPMHMRGSAPTFTDTAHLILATNPFVPLSILFGIAAFKNWFRFYSAATGLVLLLTAVAAFQYAPEVQANLGTPGLGLFERSAQYACELWQIILAVYLLRQSKTKTY